MASEIFPYQPKVILNFSLKSFIIITQELALKHSKNKNLPLFKTFPNFYDTGILKSHIQIRSDPSFQSWIRHCLGPFLKLQCLMLSNYYSSGEQASTSERGIYTCYQSGQEYCYYCYEIGFTYSRPTHQSCA